jgi:hypothetical protein
MTLSDDELDALRDVQAEYLPESCDILEVTRVSDGAGGFVETWEPIALGVPCRKNIERGLEVVMFGVWRSYERSVITLPWGTEIGKDNRIEYAGEVYAITAENEPSSWRTACRVIVEKVIQ